MKKTLALLLVLFLLPTLAACRGGGTPLSADIPFDDTEWKAYEGYGITLEYPSSWMLYSFSEGLALVLPEGEKHYRYIDRTGAVVIDGVRDGDSLLGMTGGAYTEPFCEGLAAVHLDTPCSQDQVYINSSGEIVVDAEFIPKLPGTTYANEYCFDVATLFRNGLAAVMRSQNSGTNVFIGLFESAYIIDTTGHVTATVAEYLTVDGDGFDPNMLIGVTGSGSYISGELYGLCDTGGNIVVPCEYSRLKYCENGLYLAEKDGKYGFIDKTGAVVLDLIYDSATPFACGVAAVEADGMWGLIDESGAYVVEPAYDGVELLERRLGTPLYGAAAACNVAALCRGDYWAIFDVGGMPLTEFCFSSKGGHSPFVSCSHDMIDYTENGLYGLLYLDGRPVCDPAFKSIGCFSDAG